MTIERFLTWIRQHWILAIVIFSVVPILTVHFLFQIDLGLGFLVPKWDAGDLLGYIAGFYTFIGTILLGAVTVDQSQKAQKTNERLALENNYLQKIIAQNLIPLVRIICFSVEDAKSSCESVNDLDGKVLVTTRSTSPTGGHVTQLKIVLPDTKPENLYVKKISLSLENISEGIIRQIAVEWVEFPGFHMDQEYIDLVSCQGHEKYKFIGDLLLPHEQLEIEICVYYSDSRYTQFWEFGDDYRLGSFAMCLYLENTSISDIVRQEKIYIEKANGLKEKIMYRTFEEDQVTGSTESQIDSGSSS